MKKIFLSILILVSFTVQAQRMLVLPDTPRFANQNKGVWVLRIADNLPYYSNGYRWVLADAGSISPTTIHDSLEAFKSRIVTSFNGKRNDVKGVDSMWFNGTKDTVKWRYNNIIYSSSMAQVDTTGKWISNMNKNAAGDSIIFYKGATRYALEDRGGGGGGSDPLKQNFSDTSTTDATRFWVKEQIADSNALNTLDRVLKRGSTTSQDYTINAGANKLYFNWDNLYSATQHLYVNNQDYSDWGDDSGPYSVLNLGAWETTGDGNSNAVMIGNHGKHGVRLNAGNIYGEHKVLYTTTDSIVMAAYNAGSWFVGLKMTGSGTGPQTISFPGTQQTTDTTGKKIAVLNSSKQLQVISLSDLHLSSSTDTALINNLISDSLSANTFYAKNAGSGADSIAYPDGDTLKFKRPVGGDGIIISTTSTANNHRVDSAKYATRLRVQKAIDSLGALIGVGGGGIDTLWTANHNAAHYELNNLSKISVYRTLTGGAAPSSFDPANHDAVWTLSGSNSIATASGGSYGVAKAVDGKSSGTHIATFTVTSGGGALSIGLATASTPLSGVLGTEADTYCYKSDGTRRNANSDAGYGATYTAGDVIEMTLSSGTLSFKKNGAAQGTAFSGLSGTFYPAISSFFSAAVVTADFSGWTGSSGSNTYDSVLVVDTTGKTHINPAYTPTVTADSALFNSGSSGELKRVFLKNIGNSDLTLNGNRILNGDGHKLTFNNFDSVRFSNHVYSDSSFKAPYLYGGDLNTKYSGYTGLILGSTDKRAVFDLVDNGTRVGEFYTTDSSMNMWTDVGKGFYFFVNNNFAIPVIAAASGGNVGISVPVPTEKFHVYGSLRFAGNGEGAGKVLTSDANGVATWQTPSGGFTQTVATDANITAAASKVYVIPSGVLTANRNFDVSGLSTDLNSIRIYNYEGTYTFNFTGGTVYLLDGVTTVPSISNPLTIIEKVNGKLTITN